MGNYGCYPDCAEKASVPLYAEASINLIRRKPINSVLAHGKRQSISTATSYAEHIMRYYYST